MLNPIRNDSPAAGGVNVPLSAITKQSDTGIHESAIEGSTLQGSHVRRSSFRHRSPFCVRGSAARCANGHWPQGLGRAAEATGWQQVALGVRQAMDARSGVDSLVARSASNW